MNQLTIGVVTSAALLDSINPCAISVLLLTLGYLLSLRKSRNEIYKIGCLYILAVYCTYLLIGLGILQALTLFNMPHTVAKFGAVFIGLTGIINVIGYIFPQFPIKLKIPNKAHGILAKYIKEATYTSAFFLGVLVGLFEFPCTGGPYLTILSLLHTRETFFSGFLYLLYYNFIFVLPLIVVLITANSSIVVKKLDTWRKEHTKKVDIISSVFMILLAIIIFLFS